MGIRTVVGSGVTGLVKRRTLHKRLGWLVVIWAALGGTVFLGGCPDPVHEVVVDHQRVRAEAAFARGEQAWADRDTLDKAIEAADAYARAVENGADQALVPAARAHFFLASCHLRFDRDAREDFLRALERAVALSRQAVDRQVDPAAIYWLAEARWVWARAQGPATFLMVEDELHAMARESRSVDATYDGFGSDRMLGSLLSRTPGFAGGDLVAAERHFVAARTGAPAEPRNQIRMAAEYAVATQNRALFEELLRDVMALPGDSAERVCARRQAEQLFRKAHKFFPLEPGEH